MIMAKNISSHHQNNGYTIVPHCLFHENLRVASKFRERKQADYVFLFLYAINAYQSKSETSYSKIAKITNWHRRDIKIFLNHI